MTIQKRIHQHGGSKALDLPVSFIKKLPTDLVSIERVGRDSDGMRQNWP